MGKVRTIVLYMVWIMGASLGCAESGCKGCSIGKSMLICDYYVARKGDLSHQSSCLTYARSVDIDGASAKAAWYYLLGGQPQKALDAAKRALSLNQVYAAGYAAMAKAALGNKREATSHMVQFRMKVKEKGYFDKELDLLSRVYKNRDFSFLKD